MSLGYRLNSRAMLAIRRLLRADTPAPARSPVEIAAEMERNYRWNFAVNLGDQAFFWFGLSFASHATILPLFVSKLSDSPVPIAILAAVAQGGWYLPQLFTANVVERLHRKKPIVVNLGFFLERLPTWLLPLAALLAFYSPTLALATFLIGYATFSIGAGLVGGAWQDLMARCFPAERRGRMLGVGFFLGAGAGALGAGLSAQILSVLPFPRNFVLLFGLAALSISVSWLALALTREPEQRSTAPHRSQREFFTDLPHMLRRDSNFRRYIGARLTLAFGTLAIGFVTVSAVERWGIPDGTVGIYTTLMLVGQTLGNIVAGYIADHFGHKLSLQIATLAATVAFVMAWLAPSPDWYFAVFALLGFKTGAEVVSGVLIVMEFSPPDRRPTYIGLASTLTGVVNIAAPFAGAALAISGYSALFAMAAFINGIALAWLRWGVREPRYATNQPPST